MTAAADRAEIIELIELDEAECHRLLAESEIGRVVFTQRTKHTIAVPLQRLTGRRLVTVATRKG